MPIYASVEITFTTDLIEGDTLNIQSHISGVPNWDDEWIWVASRSTSYEVTTGTPTATAGERTAINFKAAFDLDHPTGYLTLQTDNVVTISSTTDYEDFVDIQFGSTNTGGGTVDIVSWSLLGNTYVEKYYISYCDDFGTSRRVSILQKDYVGSATELTGDVNPISITYESSDDFFFSPIRPSTAEVFMLFDTEGSVDFEEFWTADEREYQVQDIKDGTIEWIGYVVPNGFQYEFVGGWYHASITASDGLSTLEAITFVDDQNKPYGNQDLVYNDRTDPFEFPPILIFCEILKKLDLDLDLWTCVDSYEKNMTKTGDTRNADPLATCYVNVKTYIKAGENEQIPYWYGSGEEWNCKDVIENLLYMFGAKLYQEWGIWRIKSINADIDYGTGDTQRYWRKYNTAATYLYDYETVNDQVNIPCGNSLTFLKGNDHIMYMDDVYRKFRMNYEYTFLREGDTPFELLTNGSFCDFNNTSILAAPTGWERWRWSDKWYIRIKDITISSGAGGNTCGIEIGTHKSGIPTSQGSIVTDSNPAIWTALQTTTDPYVEKGSKLTFSIWNKYKHLSDNGNVAYYPVYKMFLISEVTQKAWVLRNNVIDDKKTYTWEEQEIGDGGFEDIPFQTINTIPFFYLDYFESKTTDVLSTTYDWLEFSHELEPTPEAGYIIFRIHGLAADKGRSSDAFPAFLVYRDWQNLAPTWLKVVRENWVDEGGDIPRLQVTGASLGIIPNASELPQQQDYIYENTNTNYTLQVEPITVYNGDTQNAKHISNIIVPSNVSGGKNFWDDLGDTYGTSSLGLLTVRQIMRQYNLPYRVFEGDVKVQDARFGTIYTFSAIPSIRFALLRCTFNKQKQYIENATFRQLTDDTLPDGGYEGGDTLDADWQPTGTQWCEQVSGLNTGFLIVEEQDINPNSETYQDTREVTGDYDTASCPIATPRLYYWGSDDIYLNVNTLVFAPFTEISSKEIQIDFDNIEGNYLYFVHLKTLGVVERIYTLTTPGNVVADWVYLADAIINGYTYRVLRTDYVMTEFTNFTHNIVFA